ncbi:AsnC family protein [Actinomadura rubteroloni]|uniref:AsnC family protein n=1 Tax=Actinomadura rubteroloni TaxID=1926885 RepID=A0A2P4UQH0_9ACTN|nr:Lrp/AsnC ligand binding domain-containing protein [Actinomadura rubteroloni]POM27290.1 AsnC family protein [Actinomadura rubteroloni]
MVRAYVLIQTDAGRAADVVEHVRHAPGIGEVAAVTGPYDVIAQIEAADVAVLGRTVLDSVQSAPGVVRTLTCPITSL